MSRPQSYSGGCTPRPMNESPANASSAPPAPIVALTMSGSPMFGSTCRNSTRTRPTPPMRAAETKSRDATPATRVWHSRAKLGAPARPIAQVAPTQPVPKIDREEEGEQQAGEGDGDADDPRHAAAGPAHEPGRDAEDEPRGHGDDGGHEGEHDRQARGDEHAQQEVAAECVGADRMLGRRAGEDVAGVDGRRLGAPEDRGEDRGHQHEGEEDDGGEAERRAHGAGEQAHQDSATVVRGSSPARMPSTIVLMTSTPAP